MSDVDVVKAIYEALAAKDIERLIELIDPSFVLDQDPALPWGGHYEGHDGFGEFALLLTGNIDSAVTTIAMFEADGEVFQMGHTKGTVVASGAPFDVPEVHRWRIEAGKAVKADFAIDTNLMLEALSA
jgi:ketosteroid isomerase-like protein